MIAEIYLIKMKGKVVLIPKEKKESKNKKQISLL